MPLSQTPDQSEEDTQCTGQPHDGKSKIKAMQPDPLLHKTPRVTPQNNDPTLNPHTQQEQQQ